MCYHPSTKFLRFSLNPTPVLQYWLQIINQSINQSIKSNKQTICEQLTQGTQQTSATNRQTMQLTLVENIYFWIPRSLHPSAGRHFDICLLPSLTQAIWSIKELAEANVASSQFRYYRPTQWFEYKTKKWMRLPENKLLLMLQVSCPQTNETPLLEWTHIRLVFVTCISIFWHISKDWHI